MENHVKNEVEYQDVEFDGNAIKEAYHQIKKAKKHPTSINLSEEVVVALKGYAQKKGIPYQTLMRMFILEGLERLKKSA